MGSVSLGLLLPLCAGAMQRVEQRAFDYVPGGTVIVDTHRGPINVIPDNRRDVMVTLSLESPIEDEARAREAIDALVFEMTPQGDDLLITVRNPRETGVRFIWQDDARVEVAIDVLVPMHCNLDLRTSGGNITVGSMSGRLAARTESGTIFFRRIEGSVEATNKHGDIIVSRCSGSVNLRTVAGDVRVGTIGGSAVLETMNGNIEVQTALNSVVAKAADGDIEAGFAQIVDGSSLQTAVGNITATFNPESAFRVHASSRWGRVISDLQLEAPAGGTGRGRLVGALNGGGPLIDLRADGGHVKLEPGRPLFDF